MPPFSPGIYGSLPNSRKLFWPGKPCQPSTPPVHGLSMRPEDSVVEQLVMGGVAVVVVQALGGSLLLGPFWMDLPPQSAPLQYTDPGTRRLVGTETISAVLARYLPIVEVPHGG